MKKFAVVILIFSIVGILISAYSLYLHEEDTSTFCNFNATFSCDIVNQGTYSEIADIPVAAVGIFGYFILGVGSLLLNKQKIWYTLTLIACILGLGFALYLLSIEIFVLKTYCVMCLCSQADILAIFLTLLISRKSFQQRNN
ncbi:MAG: vitamin K epoxide reductase family protein [Patescibacteria group bacterium]|jgi:uncharacterized membrane protein